MRLTVYTFAVAALFCAVTYEASQAAPIASPGGLRTRPSTTAQVYSHHRPRILIPVNRLTISLIHGLG
jgi:hypothetical protein